MPSKKHGVVLPWPVRRRGETASRRSSTDPAASVLSRSASSFLNFLFPSIIPFALSATDFSAFGPQTVILDIYKTVMIKPCLLTSLTVCVGAWRASKEAHFMLRACLGNTRQEACVPARPAKFFTSMKEITLKRYAAQPRFLSDRSGAHAPGRREVHSKSQDRVHFWRASRRGPRACRGVAWEKTSLTVDALLTGAP